VNFNEFLEIRIPFNRRKFREKYTIKTIISNEATKLAMCLRGQKQNYSPFVSN